MKGISLKKALQLYGATNIELHKGYYYCYGFFEKEGQLYYISTGDIRVSTPFQRMFVLTRACETRPSEARTAKDRRDYTGGTNQFTFVSWLKGEGYYLNKIPHEK